VRVLEKEEELRSLEGIRRTEGEEREIQKNIIILVLDIFPQVWTACIYITWSSHPCVANSLHVLGITSN